MATTTKLVTYEEWLNMPEVQDATEEVVNGEIRIMPPPKFEHALIVHALRRALERQVDPETVYVLDTQFGLIIRRAPLTSRVLDIAVFQKSNLVVLDGYIHSAPALVVEVLSPANTRAERAEKLQDYAAIGVPEVWVAVPKDRTIEVLLLKEGKLTTVALLRDGALRPTQFPEVTVDISSVWPD